MLHSEESSEEEFFDEKPKKSLLLESGRQNALLSEAGNSAILNSISILESISRTLIGFSNSQLFRFTKLLNLVRSTSQVETQNIFSLLNEAALYETCRNALYGYPADKIAFKPFYSRFAIVSQFCSFGLRFNVLTNRLVARLYFDAFIKYNSSSDFSLVALVDSSLKAVSATLSELSLIANPLFFYDNGNNLSNLSALYASAVETYNEFNTYCNQLISRESTDDGSLSSLLCNISTNTLFPTFSVLVRKLTPKSFYFNFFCWLTFSQFAFEFSIETIYFTATQIKNIVVYLFVLFRRFCTVDPYKIIKVSISQSCLTFKFSEVFTLEVLTRFFKSVTSFSECLINSKN